MAILTVTRYALFDCNANQLIAVDMHSGGYPYPVAAPDTASLWDDPEGASGYASHFASKNYVVVKYTITVSEV